MAAANANRGPTGVLRFADFGAAFGRSSASAFFAAAMRFCRDSMRVIFGILPAGFALFFGSAFFATGFFAAAFFAAVFLVDVSFPALELGRALREELAFFIVTGILNLRFENVKPIVQYFA